MSASQPWGPPARPGSASTSIASARSSAAWSKARRCRLSVFLRAVAWPGSARLTDSKIPSSIDLLPFLVSIPPGSPQEIPKHPSTVIRNRHCARPASRKAINPRPQARPGITT